VARAAAVRAALRVEAGTEAHDRREKAATATGLPAKAAGTVTGLPAKAAATVPVMARTAIAGPVLRGKAVGTATAKAVGTATAGPVLLAKAAAGTAIVLLAKAVGTETAKAAGTATVDRVLLATVAAVAAGTGAAKAADTATADRDLLATAAVAAGTATGLPGKVEGAGAPHEKADLVADRVAARAPTARGVLVPADLAAVRAALVAAAADSAVRAVEGGVPPRRRIVLKTMTVRGATFPARRRNAPKRTPNGARPAQPATKTGG
jgi:hypothetical protein